MLPGIRSLAAAMHLEIHRVYIIAPDLPINSGSYYTLWIKIPVQFKLTGFYFVSEEKLSDDKYDESSITLSYFLFSSFDTRGVIFTLLIR